ncbi:MAG: type II toxin-antitoxin system VapC family toxin [Euryarchaeota archaeon]|nr:type II toxin-antitoxin system VapC family toxin [Euryarchaeota archaeon]
MRFLDANVFLFARLDEGTRGESARLVLRELDGNHPAATTAVVLNEVFWNLRKPLGRAEALQKSRQLASMPGLKILDVGERAWSRALGLMRDHAKLQPNDALHAAAAMEAGIVTIVSADEDFDGLPNLRRQALPSTGS